MTVKKLTRGTALAVSVLLLAAQLVPVKRTNPPSLGTLAAPPDIDATLKRACYDCHSSETRWAMVQPRRAALVAHRSRRDAQPEGSELLRMGGYYPTTRKRKLEWIGRALREERMPSWSYRLLHPGARLTEADRTALEGWIESALAAPSTENK